MELSEKLRQVCGCFQIRDTFAGFARIQTGNVNQTYKVDFRREDGSLRSFLVQNVNTYAFRQPIELMENIDRVTQHLHGKCPEKTNLHFYRTEDQKTYLIDGENFWRVTDYIDSVTFSSVSDLSIIRGAGRAFGEFQQLLSDFDISLLHETIPGFHNTRRRYENLKQAMEADPVGRVAEVQPEIAFCMEVEELACRLTDLLQAGELPLRVTHNDTKINNILFRPEDNQPLTVIDLDTVMPGLIGHDFGDAIRFAANLVEEDCPEPEKAGVNMEVFRAFAEGYLEMTAGTMTEKEMETLAVSCFDLTAELVVRFLEDYIRGDPYFNIRYPKHNLVRARCQMALCRDMLKKMDAMDAIIRECASAAKKNTFKPVR